MVSLHDQARMLVGILDHVDTTLRLSERRAVGPLTQRRVVDRPGRFCRITVAEVANLFTHRRLVRAYSSVKVLLRPGRVLTSIEVGWTLAQAGAVCG